MDIFDFICGTVPLIFFLHGHGPRGPWPWAVFLAGGLGGIAAVALFGAKYAGDGGAVSTFTVASRERSPRRRVPSVVTPTNGACMPSTRGRISGANGPGTTWLALPDSGDKPP